MTRLCIQAKLSQILLQCKLLRQTDLCITKPCSPPNPLGKICRFHFTNRVLLFFNIKRNRILTAPPTTTPNPLERYKITSSFNADGCIMAVESPVNRPLTAPKTPGAPSSILTTTAAPRGSQSGLNNGRPSPPTTKGYFISKLAKMRDHVLDRVSMFYLTRALPPTTTPATTTTAKPLKCTSANGNFPYGGDCKKFINCWQYRPYLQLCPEGKLFSTAFSTCEDAVKVNCQSNRSDSRYKI